MHWVIRAYSCVLLAYTGWRTYDLLVLNLPNDWSSSLLALLFLFAAEIGLILWHEASISSTSTYSQHYTATALTWLDFLGSTVAGVGDMVMRQTIVQDYEIPALLATLIIYGLPALMALNVAGALIYLSNDARSVKDRERRMLAFEAHDQAIRELRDHRQKLVKQAKRDIYAEISGEIPEQLDSPQSAARGRPRPIYHHRLGRNGRKPYAAEERLDPTSPAKGEAP